VFRIGGDPVKAGLVGRFSSRPGDNVIRRQQNDDEVTGVIVPMTGATSVVEIELVKARCA